MSRIHGGKLLQNLTSREELRRVRLRRTRLCRFLVCECQICLRKQLVIRACYIPFSRIHYIHQSQCFAVLKEDKTTHKTSHYPQTQQSCSGARPLASRDSRRTLKVLYFFMSIKTRCEKTRGHTNAKLRNGHILLRNLPQNLQHLKHPIRNRRSFRRKCLGKIDIIIQRLPARSGFS